MDRMFTECLTRDVLRLCRPMCGKALPFRPRVYFSIEAMPHLADTRRRLGSLKDYETGKAKPFRTSDGEAVRRLHIGSRSLEEAIDCV
jgi:hypothetical protein